jgi:hypothetical protein
MKHLFKFPELLREVLGEDNFGGCGGIGGEVVLVEEGEGEEGVDDEMAVVEEVSDGVMKLKEYFFGGFRYHIQEYSGIFSTLKDKVNTTFKEEKKNWGGIINFFFYFILPSLKKFSFPK